MKEARARPILLVDDAEADRDVLVRAYKRVNPDQQIVACATATEARQRLESASGSGQVPALAILDISMPDESGLDLLADLRTAFPSLPIVMLSGSARPHDVESAYRSGAAGFFQKPMGLSALASILESIDRYWFDSVELPVRHELSDELDGSNRSAP